MRKKIAQKFWDIIRWRFRSLTGKLVILILLASLISFAFFWLMNTGVGSGLDAYFAKSSYAANRENACIQKFQEYVSQNKLTPFDEQKLSKWIKRQKVIYLEIYRNSRLLYAPFTSGNSKLSDKDAAFSEYEGNAYGVAFADGEAAVRLYGVFEYQYYVYAMVVEILLSFLIFLTVFIWGVKKGIHYIQRIQSEICVMEGGCMDQKVTVSGEDELAQLAQGLEKMRLSLKRNMEEERSLRQAYQCLITGIAHDLRTPLTSLTVYVEILQSNICRIDKTERHYLDKIMEKAVLIKKISDELFESCQLKTESESRGPDVPQSLQYIFEDYLSEMTVFLRNQGFGIEADLEWRPGGLSVRMDYIARIMDNLSTNLTKYAEPRELIWLRTVYEEEWVGIEICNRIKEWSEHMESTKVGLENIKCMMQSMGGVCLISEYEERFKVKLLFPVREGWEETYG